MSTTKNDSKVRKLAFLGSVAASVIGAIISFGIATMRAQANLDSRLTSIEMRLDKVEITNNVNSQYRLQIEDIKSQMDISQQQLISQQEQLVEIWKAIGHNTNLKNNSLGGVGFRHSLFNQTSAHK